MDKSIHSSQQAQLRRLLKEARKAARLSQIELAQRLHAYKSYVSKYENGERRLDVIEFMAVSKAIGIDPFKLLKKLQP